MGSDKTVNLIDCYSIEQILAVAGSPNAIPTTPDLLLEKKNPPRQGRAGVIRTDRVKL